MLQIQKRKDERKRKRQLKTLEREPQKPSIIESGNSALLRPVAGTADGPEVGDICLDSVHESVVKQKRRRRRKSKVVAGDGFLAKAKKDQAEPFRPSP
jgi:hypothetical protein